MRCMKNILHFDDNSIKIFYFLFNTQKNIKLYGISGSDDFNIDKILETLAPYTQWDPMHNLALPHNTCDKYFKVFIPEGFTNYDFDDNRVRHNHIGRLVFLYPETGMNIREQQKFVNTLIEKILEIDIEQNDFEIIIVTNSLWILSDIPSGNVNVFNKEECKSAKGNFFAGNLIDILVNFSPDIMTGRLSASYASKLIKMANDFRESFNNKDFPNQELVEFISDNMIKGYIKNCCNL